MPEIELQPHEYRLKGTRRIIRSILHKPVFMKIATVCGVWFACWLYAPTAGIHLDPWWLRYPIAVAPGLVLGILLLVFDD